MSYTPRMEKAMATLEDPTFFCIPPLSDTWRLASLTDMAQLTVTYFSGQLYLKDFDTYLHLLLILGLVGEETKVERTYSGPGGKAAVSSNRQTTVMVRYNLCASRLRARCLSWRK